MFKFMNEFNFYFINIYYLLVPAFLVMVFILINKYKKIKDGAEKEDKELINKVYSHIDSISEETDTLKGNIRNKIEEIETLGFIQLIRTITKKEKRKPDPFYKQVYKALVKNKG